MNIQRLKEAVASRKVKVVSFDLFDTLLSRPCVLPYMMFRVAGRRCEFAGDFESIRREAERIARQKRPAGHDDVTFDDIYRELALLIGEEPARRLQQAEMQVEADYLYPRKPIAEVYRYALSLRKQVIIVSDMYLPAPFLESVVRKNGYTGHQKFYLSSDYLLTKHTGRLFEKVAGDLAAEGIAPSEMLHIGDNAHSDVLNASEYGLQTFHVECGNSVLQKINPFGVPPQAYSEEAMFLLGLIANFFFDPFREDASPAAIDSAEAMYALVKRLLQSGEKTQLELLQRLARDRMIPETLL